MLNGKNCIIVEPSVIYVDNINKRTININIKGVFMSTVLKPNDYKYLEIYIGRTLKTSRRSRRTSSRRVLMTSRKRRPFTNLSSIATLLSQFITIKTEYIKLNSSVKFQDTKISFEFFSIQINLNLILFHYLLRSHNNAMALNLSQVFASKFLPLLLV